MNHAEKVLVLHVSASALSPRQAKCRNLSHMIYSPFVPPQKSNAHAKEVLRSSYNIHTHVLLGEESSLKHRKLHLPPVPQQLQRAARLLLASRKSSRHRRTSCVHNLRAGFGPKHDVLLSKLRALPRLNQASPIDQLNLNS